MYDIKLIIDNILNTRSTFISFFFFDFFLFELIVANDIMEYIKKKYLLVYQEKMQVNALHLVVSLMPTER